MVTFTTFHRTRIIAAFLVGYARLRFARVVTLVWLRVTFTFTLRLQLLAFALPTVTHDFTAHLPVDSPRCCAFTLPTDVWLRFPVVVVYLFITRYVCVSFYAVITRLLLFAVALVYGLRSLIGLHPVGCCVPFAVALARFITVLLFLFRVARLLPG